MPSTANVHSRGRAGENRWVGQLLWPRDLGSAFSAQGFTLDITRIFVLPLRRVASGRGCRFLCHFIEI